MTTSGKPRGAPSRAQESDDRTNPGGPAPEVLAEARREAEEDAPAAPAPGDATLIYDKNRKTPANEAPRLLVIAGPRNGSEFLLTEVETSIGRGSDSVVVIPDISVSRKHVVIAREADKYVLIDQGSGNGTRLNGRSVDRSVLQSGDEIAMGDTVVKFLEPGGVVVKPKSGRVASPANAARPSLGDVPDDTQNSGKSPKGQKAGKAAPAAAPGLKGRGPLYVGIAVVLLVVFFVGAARKKRLEAQQAAAAREQGEGRALAQQRFEEGVRQLKDGRWAEARDKLRVAAELAPQDTEIQRYLERAEAEAPRALAIAQARTALGKRDFAQAKGQLAGVPDDSALAEAAHDLTQQLKTALDSAVREARVLVESGDGASAQSLLDAVLAAEPGRADAQAIRDAAAGARRSAAREVERERPAKKEKPEPGPAPLSPAASEILDAYLTGDIGSAMDKAENGTDARSQRLSHELKAFDAAWRDGLAKTQAKRLADAIRALEQADKIDKGLAPGKDSKLGKEVRRALGNLHYNLGVQGMAQEDTLGQAAGHLRAALAADPENGQAKKSLAEINDRAKEIYQRAYFEKDSEPDQAKKAFRLVAEALPPGDELGAKAKKWADKLDGIGQPAKASE
jgi:pSer/pThr/pTyr-binding forkhead associated (FHA) protein